MDLKQAYENFVQAIKEETGAEPVICIYFHTTKNKFSPEKAFKVAEKMQEAMDLSSAIKQEADNNTHWYGTPAAGNSVTVFFNPAQEAAHD